MFLIQKRKGEESEREQKRKRRKKGWQQKGGKETERGTGGSGEAHRKFSMKKKITPCYSAQIDGKILFKGIN